MKTKDTLERVQNERRNLLVSMIITIVAIASLVLKFNFWHKPEDQFTRDELILLAVAVLPWIAQFVKTFKFGKDGVEVTTQDFRQVKEIAKAALDAGLRGVKGKEGHKALAAATGTKAIIKGADNDDPQKGKWGGKSSVNHRELKAAIERIPGEELYRRVVLTVSSSDPKGHPLKGNVTFHLHPTFSEPDYSEPVVDGVATTSLVSYGAFTVGVEADDGHTRLELDLTSLDDKKDQFFKR